MKKSRKAKPARKKPIQPAPAPTPAKVSRRQAMGWLQYGILGTVVVGGVGGYAVTSVRASMQEHDLSVIGNGLPTVVQIHDPACQQCTTLQGIARRVIDGGFDGEINFRVASLVTEDGQAFAREHGVTRVTLLLFNGAGQVTEVLTGPRRAVQLEAYFQNLVAADA